MQADGTVGSYEKFDVGIAGGHVAQGAPICPNCGAGFDGRYSACWHCGAPYQAQGAPPPGYVQPQQFQQPQGQTPTPTSGRYGQPTPIEQAPLVPLRQPGAWGTEGQWSQPEWTPAPEPQRVRRPLWVKLVALALSIGVVVAVYLAWTKRDSESSYAKQSASANYSRIPESAPAA